MTQIGLPAALGGGAFLGTTCRTGIVQPQAPIGIPLPGDFILVSPTTGRTVAALVGQSANLSRFVGRLVTVCGTLGAQVEGVDVLTVASISPTGGFGKFPFSGKNFDVQCFLVPSFATPFGGGIGGKAGLGLGGKAGLGGLGGINPLGLGGLGGKAGLGGINPLALGGLGGINPLGLGGIGGINPLGLGGIGGINPLGLGGINPLGLGGQII